MAIGTKSLKGRFKPRNFMKYKGNPTQIFYRSSWELKLMMAFDSNPNILEWNSECIVIPYMSPKDNKVHRYFPDFYIKTRKADGMIEKSLVEVKPHSQTKPPSKKSKHLTEEVMTYAVNQAKWDAAKAYCQAKGYKFMIVTENDLGLGRKRKKK